MKLTDLPVLNRSNTEEFPQWHAYVQRIYGATLAYPIDLNTFTWFYWFAPIRLNRIYLCDWDDEYAEVPYGTPWTGGVEAWEWGPEHVVRRAGFFVHRRRWLSGSYRPMKRLEVHSHTLVLFPDAYSFAPHTLALHACTIFGLCYRP